MTNIRDVFAANLKKYRQARGWSQAFLAEKAETSTNYIGLLENTLKFPSSEMVQKLAIALGIDPTELFSKELDPTVTIKTYQKLALEDMGAIVGALIGEKIQELDREIREGGNADTIKNPEKEAEEEAD
jgi:transcriptional regulator with XRE-family HTH domain